MSDLENKKQKAITHFKKMNENEMLFKTSYGLNKYSNLFYGDKKNKICFAFTPRSGCSVVFQQFLDLFGLLKPALDYNQFIHFYRNEIINPNINHLKIENLIQEKYNIIKFVQNPYIRAVSVFLIQKSHNFSFRDYLKKILVSDDFLNTNDKYHYHPQYICGEEKIITKYIKIDKNEKFEIKIDGKPYVIDLKKYNSVHHIKKNINNTQFCGDIPLEEVFLNAPKTYKYFYDDEIKELVEKLYKNDIINYGYSFNDFDY